MRFSVRMLVVQGRPLMLRSRSHGIDVLTRLFVIQDFDQIPPIASLLDCVAFQFPKTTEKL
jgi:hypothetical protein